MIFTKYFSLHAGEIRWPDANEFRYPEYEVQLYNSFIIQIRKAERKFHVDPEKYSNYLYNFNYDLKIHKNNPITPKILLKLFNSFNDILIISQNEKIKSLIVENENTYIFDDPAIIRKFLTWVCIQVPCSDYEKIKNNKSILFEFENRRKKLLESIINNSSEYAPLASYLLTVKESEILLHRSSESLLHERINTLDAYMAKYPGTKFSALAGICKLYCYGKLKKYDQAMNLANEIINGNTNFYVGGSDLYHDVYTELISICTETKKIEMARMFIEKLNKNAEGYDDLILYYTTVGVIKLPNANRSK